MSEWVAAPHPFEMFLMRAGADFNGPGVYHWSRAADPQSVYVGMASNMGARLADHRRAGMLTVIGGGQLNDCSSPAAAVRLERASIWMLDPSENEARPAPSGPLWAGTLGESRPIHDGWSWWPVCGHVFYRGRALATVDEVLEADCPHPAWSGWLAAARSYVEGMEAKSALPPLEPVYVTAPCERCPELEAEAVRLQDEVDRLNYQLTRVEWNP